MLGILSICDLEPYSDVKSEILSISVCVDGS